MSLLKLNRRLALRVFCLLCACASGLSSAWAVDPLFQQQVLFSSGDGYTAYRIPSIIQAGGNTLVAFAEGRPTVSDSGENDIVLRRSLDGGQTWQPMQVVLNHSILNFPTQGFNSPTPVYDRDTGEIVLVICRTAQSGMYLLNEMYVSKSSDAGLTWSTPVDITSQVRPNNDVQLSPGTGHAIQSSSGRLIMPYYTREFNSSTSSAAPRVIYSDDHGASWQIGDAVPRDTISGQTKPISLVEPSIVETENGLYMTTRTRAFASGTARSESWSTDDGLTWSTAQQDPTLIDANVQGSVQRWTTAAEDGVNRLLLSNVAGPTAREHLVLHTSYDEALSWTNQKTVTFGLAAYSDMTTSADGRMNLLYENGRIGDPRYSTALQFQQITLAQFNTEWLETPQTYAMRLNFNEATPGTTVSQADGAIQDENDWNIDATASGSMIYVQGKSDSAIHLSSSGDHVVIRGGDARQFFELAPESSFAIDVSLRTLAHDSGGDAGSGVIMGRGILNGAHWWMEITNGYLRLDLRDNAGNMADLFSDVKINDGLWHDLIVGRDADLHQLELYIDGRLSSVLSDPTSSFSSLFSNSDIYIGQLSDGSRQLEADLDSLGFSLASPSQVQANAVPEPSSFVLAGIAAGGAWWRRRRSRDHGKLVPNNQLATE